MTDLFIATCGLEAAAVAAAVPPACRRPVAVAPRPVHADGDVLVELPAWRPRNGVRHLLPALSVLGEGEYSYRFEVSVSAAGAWTPWVGGAALGPAPFAPIPARAGALGSDIDVFTTSEPVAEVRLRVRLHAGDLPALATARWLVSLSAGDGAAPSPSPRLGSGHRSLPVPPRSQMEEHEAVRHRICSPTSVAMVLEYLGARVETDALAAAMLHPGLDLYGVWPAAIRAAGRHGIAGYLLRFPDWATAAWCLEARLPIIASVRYGAGELTGAPIPETTGHLLVLRGYDGDRVLVNDPAAPARHSVARAYRLDEIERVWLGRSGVGYVLFRPEAQR
jgi:hypothetical protein